MSKKIDLSKPMPRAVVDIYSTRVDSQYAGEAIIDNRVWRLDGHSPVNTHDLIIIAARQHFVRDLGVSSHLFRLVKRDTRQEPMRWHESG